MPPLIAFAGALGGLAVVRWAYRTALRVNKELEEARLAGSLKRHGRAIFRRCGGIPPPAPIGRDDLATISLEAPESTCAGPGVGHHP